MSRTFLVNITIEVEADHLPDAIQFGQDVVDFSEYDFRVIKIDAEEVEE